VSRGTSCVAGKGKRIAETAIVSQRGLVVFQDAETVSDVKRRWRSAERLALIGTGEKGKNQGCQRHLASSLERYLHGDSGLGEHRSSQIGSGNGIAHSIECLDLPEHLARPGRLADRVNWYGDQRV